MSVSEPQARVGHVHLRVADLDRAVSFYRDVIGLSVSLTYRDQAAFMAFGDYHHHLGLNVWDSKGATPPPKGHTGLYHTAFLFPDRPALARALTRVWDAGIKLTGWADHGVSEAIYFDDPDGNGVELYWDRPKSEWPLDADGNLTMINQRFDLNALAAEASG